MLGVKIIERLDKSVQVAIHSVEKIPDDENHVGMCFIRHIHNPLREISADNMPKVNIVNLNKFFPFPYGRQILNIYRMFVNNRIRRIYNPIQAG